MTYIKSAYATKDPVKHPSTDQPSRVKQEFKKEVNINTIVSRIKNGQQPPAWMTSNTPFYGDFSDMPASFAEAHEIMARGKAAFDSLPLEFRRELDHNPMNLDRAPRELFERFGLIKKVSSSEETRQGVKGERVPPKKATSKVPSTSGEPRQRVAPEPETEG